MQYVTLSPENLVSVVIVVISIILSLFLLTSKSKNKKANIFLALFLLANAQDSSGLIASYFIYPDYPGWGMIVNSTVFLKVPLLYLYFQAVIYSDFEFRFIQLWHLSPWLLNLLMFVPRFYAVDFDAKWTFLTAADNKEFLEIRASYILVHVQILIYIFLSYSLIWKYRKLLLENYSNASLFNYKWLIQLITVFALEFILAAFKNVFMFLNLESAYNYTHWATSLSVLGIICWMVLKALHNPELFKGISSELRMTIELRLDNPMNDLYPDKLEEISQLKKYMQEEKPFLDPSLTVTKLARQLKLSTKDLSLLINQSLNQHFFDFINGYRIRAAMKILQDPERRAYTVLEILYEVGFNSKSSFNTAFKKHTSLTPTDYRKKYCKSIT
jgi:AraC-like DNA-binding protein